MRRFFLMLLPCALLLTMAVVNAREDGPDSNWKKTGNAKAVQLEQCVEDTDVMRRDHMTFLMHQRDETMYKGIRTKQHSLVNCINCHANKDEQGKFIPVNAKDQFCQTCHAFTGVTMDCFQCHATKPRDAAKKAYHPLFTPKMKKLARMPQNNSKGTDLVLDNSDPLR